MFRKVLLLAQILLVVNLSSCAWPGKYGGQCAVDDDCKGGMMLCIDNICGYHCKKLNDICDDFEPSMKCCSGTVCSGFLCSLPTTIDCSSPTSSSYATFACAYKRTQTTTNSGISTVSPDAVTNTKLTNQSGTSQIIESSSTSEATTDITSGLSTMSGTTLTPPVRTVKVRNLTASTSVNGLFKRSCLIWATSTNGLFKRCLIWTIKLIFFFERN